MQTHPLSKWWDHFRFLVADLIISRLEFAGALSFVLGPLQLFDLRTAKHNGIYKTIMNNDKINSSRPGRASPAALVARHARKCVICKHPEREAIEEAFIHWFHADDIVEDHGLPSRTSLRHHALATGLYDKRRRNIRYALEHVIEEATHSAVTGESVVSAIRAHSRLSQTGRWKEPPQRLIVSRGETRALPEAPCSSRPRPDSGTIREALSLESASDLSTESLTLSLPKLPKPRPITDFLIETPKRLQIAVTQTKQTTEVLSNRDNFAPPSEPV